MTVAIAALCGVGIGPMIICAEDHMITSGDVEFEQPQPKVWRLGKSAVALIHGDVSVQTELSSQTEQAVVDQNLSSVRDIANVHAAHLSAYLQRQATTAILSPLGLTQASFIAQQATMTPDLVARLSAQLQQHYADAGFNVGGAIIAGTDVLGGHLYQVENGRAEYLDSIGFVAAGSGRWHAESHFMFSRYTRHWDFPSALSLVYAAKKRAEVAPGVGTETDIVVITSNPQNVIFFPHGAPMIGELEAIWRKTRARLAAAERLQHDNVRQFVDGWLKPTSETSPPPTGQPNPPPSASDGPAPPVKPELNDEPSS